MTRSLILTAAMLVTLVGLAVGACSDKAPSSEGLRKVWEEQLLTHGYSRSDNVAYGEGDNMGGFEKRAANEYYTPEHQVRVSFKTVEIKPDSSDLYSYAGVVRFDRESPNSKATGATYYLYGRRTGKWIRKEESAIR